MYKVAGILIVLWQNLSAPIYIPQVGFQISYINVTSDMCTKDNEQIPFFFIFQPSDLVLALVIKNLRLS